MTRIQQAVRRFTRLTLTSVALFSAGVVSGADLQINFGGETDAEGWNTFGGAVAEPKALIDADGEATEFTLEMTDDFQAYENPNVAEGELTGDAAPFEPCRSASLFIASEAEPPNPTGAFVLTLDPEKTYTLTFWASRTGNGTRWTKYTVKSAAEEDAVEMLAAGDRSTKKGNTSKVARFKDIKPDEEGKITVTVSGPNELDPYVNTGGFSYLTGLIISESETAEAADETETPMDEGMQ